MNPLDQPFDPLAVGFVRDTHGDYVLGDFKLIYFGGDKWAYMMGIGIYPSLTIATFRDAQCLFQARQIHAVKPFYTNMLREYRINNILDA